jgi:hypothetical protein
MPAGAQSRAGRTTTSVLDADLVDELLEELAVLLDRGLERGRVGISEA